MVALRQRVLQLEGALRGREALVERLQRQAAETAGCVPGEKLREAEEGARWVGARWTVWAGGWEEIRPRGQQI